MVAALIVWAQARSFVRDGESTMSSYLTAPICRRFKEPETSAQLFGIDSGHNGVGFGGAGKAQLAKGSLMVLMLFLLLHRHAVPLKLPVTKHVGQS